ncbi:Hypothetical predicted protein [Octopus vulgaris]|uniref:Uncharacterized protein n=1 Tax=Octopus vulgaris TaxID=6645 RepID=A0AA36ATU7_OCTVU|nr:Hypothetical predicted protein [Octopus vulgaris]
MNTRATALLLCFFILNAMVTFNSGVSAVPSQLKDKQNTLVASENNMEQQTPRSVISSAADPMNRRDFHYYSTTSFYGYPDGKRVLISFMEQ